MNTVRLTAETARLDWISDTYDDDLPYWLELGDRDQLVIPYTLEANDMRFATAPGYIEGEQFFTYLKDSFDTLYAEGQQGRAKMFSIGLHCRLIGRPGKIAGLIRFLDYAQGHKGVWFARRIDIARTGPPPSPPPHRTPLADDTERFVERFGGIFEHSAWIAEGAWALELGPAHDCATGLHNALARIFRSAAPDQRLAVLRAHPDLAGKLAAAKRLTPESTAEQASAALDALTDDERAPSSGSTPPMSPSTASPSSSPCATTPRPQHPAGLHHPHRQRHRNRIRHRLRTGGTDRRAPPQGHPAMTGYYAPTGGLAPANRPDDWPRHLHHGLCLPAQRVSFPTSSPATCPAGKRPASG
jgi:hypothetical protein